MKNVKLKYLFMGLFVCAAVSFSCVSCVQFFTGRDSTYIDTSQLELVQKEPPENGDTIATVRTSLGDIKLVLYPEYAPETVEKFIALAESGYYDNTYVFNSEPGVYFSAGSPMKNGDLDENKPEGSEEWEREIHQNLWPFRGAICSLTTGVEGSFWDKLTGDTKTMTGSRFVVLNSNEMTEELKEQLLASNEDQTLANEFINLGGVPALSQEMTVFGQTYEGFDVIDKLTSLEVEKTEDGMCIPVEDIMIETVEIGVYGSEQTTSEDSE